MEVPAASKALEGPRWAFEWLLLAGWTLWTLLTQGTAPLCPGQCSPPSAGERRATKKTVRGVQWDSPPLCWLWGAAEGATESRGAPAQRFPSSLPCCAPPCHLGSRLRAGPSLPCLPGLPCQTGTGIGASVPCLPGPCLCPGTCPPPANTPACARGSELYFRGNVSIAKS